MVLQTKKKLLVFFDTETYKDSFLYNMPLKPGIDNCAEIAYIVGWVEVDAVTLHNYDPDNVNFKYSWLYKNFKSKAPYEDFVKRMIFLRKTHTITLVAHNVFFDIRRLFPKITDYYYKNKKKHLCLHMAKGFTKFLRGAFVARNFSCRFFDTNKFFGSNVSLKAILSQLGTKIQKGTLSDIEKWDVTFISPWLIIFTDKFGERKPININEELSYLRRDVLALPYIYKYISNFKELAANLAGMYGIKKKLTMTAGTIPTIAKRTLDFWLDGKFDILFRPESNDIHEYRQVKFSHFGGLSFFNKEYTSYEVDDESIESYDVNSMYPYIMSDLLPIGDPREFPSKDWTHTVIFIETIIEEDLEWPPCLSFMSCKILPTSYYKKYSLGDFSEYKLDENGERKPFLLTEKLFKLINILTGNALKCRRKIYFEGKKIIKDWILEQYEIKKNAKDETERDVAKNILNTIYGKMGERCELLRNTYKNFEYSGEVVEHEPTYRSCYTACHIVQMSWVFMINTIMKEVRIGNIVLMGLTDSLKIVKKSKKTLLQISETELGKWKFKGKYNYFSCPETIAKSLLITKDNKYEIKYAGLGGAADFRSVLNNLPVETIKKVFSKNYNFIFVEGKVHKYSKGLKNIDVSTNNKIPPTHKLHADGRLEELQNIKKSK